MEQSWGASAKLPCRRPPPLWTGRGQLNQGVTFSELMVLLFVLGVCMGGWEWMCEWMFAFTMPFLCVDSGPWRRMSGAWPAMSAITTSSGSACPSHRVSTWVDAELRQERFLWLLLLRVLLPADVVEHIYKCFCEYCPRRGGLRRVAVVRSICQASLPSPTTTLDRKRTTQPRRHI